MKTNFSDLLMKCSMYALVVTVFSLIAKKLKLIKRFGFRELISDVLGFAAAEIIYNEFLEEKIDTWFDSLKAEN